VDRLVDSLPGEQLLYRNNQISHDQQRIRRTQAEKLGAG